MKFSNYLKIILLYYSTSEQVEVFGVAPFFFRRMTGHPGLLLWFFSKRADDYAKFRHQIIEMLFIEETTSKRSNTLSIGKSTSEAIDESTSCE